LFSQYRGVIPDGDGNSIEIDGLTGWAEEHVAAW
jgi:hypothetical protein